MKVSSSILTSNEKTHYYQNKYQKELKSVKNNKWKSKCSQTFGILETISYETPAANIQSCTNKHIRICVKCCSTLPSRQKTQAYHNVLHNQRYLNKV